MCLRIYKCKYTDTSLHTNIVKKKHMQITMHYSIPCIYK